MSPAVINVRKMYRQEVTNLEIKGVSKATLDRLPRYLTYLNSLPEGSLANISATTIADALGLGDVQVRKDLARVSGTGKPKIGYIVKNLKTDLENFLGYNDLSDAFVVGCGKLGKALLDYTGFLHYGLNVAAGFDSSPEVIGKTDGGKEIFPIEKFPDLCKRMNILIGIICVPPHSAQQVCDMMIKCGIKGIMNFAPAHISAPSDVIVQNENLAAELAKLSGKLITRHEEELL